MHRRRIENPNIETNRPGIAVQNQADSVSEIDLPASFPLALVDFGRDGADLILRSPDGVTVVIEGYFAQAVPPALVGHNGATMPSDLVAALAGPVETIQPAEGIADQPAPIGMVTFVEGQATVIRSDGTTLELAVDSPIYEADVLVTGTGSAVGLVFNDATRFSLGEDTRAVLNNLDYDSADAGGSALISIISGSFAVAVGGIGADGFEERTLIAELDVRGASLAGQTGVSDGSFVLLPDQDGSVGSFDVTTRGGIVSATKEFHTVHVADPLAPPNLDAGSILDVDSAYGGVLDVLALLGGPEIQDLLQDPLLELAAELGLGDLATARVSAKKPLPKGRGDQFR